MKRLLAGFLGFNTLVASVAVVSGIVIGWDIANKYVRQLGIPTYQDQALNDLFFGLGSMAAFSFSPIGAKLIIAGILAAIITTVLFGYALNRQIRIGRLLWFNGTVLGIWYVASGFALAFWQTDAYLLWYLIMNPGKMFDILSIPLFIRIVETCIKLFPG